MQQLSLAVDLLDLKKTLAEEERGGSHIEMKKVSVKSIASIVKKRLEYS